MKLFVHTREEGSSERNPWATLRGGIWADALRLAALVWLVFMMIFLWVEPGETMKETLWAPMLFLAVLWVVLDAMLTSMRYFRGDLLHHVMAAPLTCHEFATALEHRLHRSIAVYLCLAIPLLITVAVFVWFSLAECVYEAPEEGVWNLISAADQSTAPTRSALWFFISPMIALVGIGVFGVVLCHLLCGFWLWCQLGLYVLYQRRAPELAPAIPFVFMTTVGVLLLVLMLSALVMEFSCPGIFGRGSLPDTVTWWDPHRMAAPLLQIIFWTASVRIGVKLSHAFWDDIEKFSLKAICAGQQTMRQSLLAVLIKNPEVDE